MPTYDFRCACSRRQVDVLVPSTVTTVACVCGQQAERQFPVEALRGFQPFTPYYDEGLGCDVNSRGHRREIMQILDVHEAGDRVHGALNFDAQAPHHVKPEPPRGIGLKPQDPEPWLVETEVAPGKWERLEPFI